MQSRGVSIWQAVWCELAFDLERPLYCGLAKTLSIIHKIIHSYGSIVLFILGLHQRKVDVPNY